MSYAGMGIAIPTGVTARAHRGVTARGVTARGWGRGVGGYHGSLGASLPSVPTTAPSAAMAAAIAVMAATATERRRSIPEVRNFQTVYGHGLTVDGIYGSATRAALVTVTGRTDLPAVGSGSGGGSTSTFVSSTTSTTTEAPPEDSLFASGISADRPWLIPVAVVSALVIVGGVIMMRRPVRANMRRRR